MSDALHDPSSSGDPKATGPSRSFTAPLNSTADGRLVFASGAAGINITADSTMPDLYRARFEQHVPSIHAQNGVVTVRYRHHSFLDWLTDWRRPQGTVTLNGSIPWDIESRGGVSNLIADLRGLSLRALDLASASQLTIMLPRPVGAAYIYMSGSASNIAIHRPADVALRVQIGSSASNVRLDEQFFGAVAEGVRWQTANYSDTVDRYEISISGSASNVTIDAH